MSFLLPLAPPPPPDVVFHLDRKLFVLAQKDARPPGAVCVLHPFRECLLEGDISCREEEMRLRMRFVPSLPSFGSSDFEGTYRIDPA
jgi:hypothetical protein